MKTRLWPLLTLHCQELLLRGPAGVHLRSGLEERESGTDYRVRGGRQEMMAAQLQEGVVWGELGEMDSMGGREDSERLKGMKRKEANEEEGRVSPLWAGESPNLQSGSVSYCCCSV